MSLFASLAIVFVPTNANAAPSNPDKITICHRTHSTTNPYRMITISKSAANGPLNVNASGQTPSSGDHAGVIHNKHKAGGSELVEWDPDFPTYNTKSGASNAPVVLADNPVRVFDPNFSYPANQKMWEDIIPPFTNGGVNYAGLNWTEKGKAIYYGLTLNGVNYAGICKTMGSLEFYNSENAAGESANNILDDIKDQANTSQDGTFTGRPSLSELKSDPPSNKGPKKPAALNTLVSNLGSTNSNKTPDQMTQAIAGVVWYDNNRDGIQDQSELLAPSVGIVLKDPTGNLYTVGYKKGGKNGIKLADYTSTKKQMFSFASTSGKQSNVQLAATVLSVTTDANGYFQFPSVPEGEWQVIVVTPTGYTYTYDSSGTNDGIMPGTLVPAGGVGFAWAGLVTDVSSGSGSGSGTGTDSSTTSALAKTGESSVAPIIGIVGFIIVGLGIALIVARRRENQ